MPEGRGYGGAKMVTVKANGRGGVSANKHGTDKGPMAPVQPNAAPVMPKKRGVGTPRPRQGQPTPKPRVRTHRAHNPY